MNDMALGQTGAIAEEGFKNANKYNTSRVNELKIVDEYFARFFLERLHFLTWNDYDKGVLSTIPFDESYKMLKDVTQPLYELLLASVDDKYSQDLSLKEMKNVIDRFNLKVD